MPVGVVVIVEVATLVLSLPCAARGLPSLREEFLEIAHDPGIPFRQLGRDLVATLPLPLPLPLGSARLPRPLAGHRSGTVRGVFDDLRLGAHR
jgi:hypothetical protein